MHIIQFVMAYKTDHDKLRAILPEGFLSLRPVLRINAELREGNAPYIELNTPVANGDIRGWLNIAQWKSPTITQTDTATTFQTEALCITFAPIGISGGCPAEKDNDGCFFLNQTPSFRKAEHITSPKEFCDCVFKWNSGIGGKSEGKTIPAPWEPSKITYPKQDFSLKSATNLPCIQVLGTYKVEFTR